MPRTSLLPLLPHSLSPSISSRYPIHYQRPANNDTPSLVSPTSNPALSNRQISISQTLNSLVPGASYTFTGFQGRLAASINDDAPVIAVNVGSQRLGQVTACSGTECTIARGSGAYYTEHTIPFTYTGTSPTADLQFVITYTSTSATTGNPPLLFDGFQLVRTG